MSLYIDLTEFLVNPLTTGIQRVAIELCRHFTSSLVTPIRLHAGGYTSLTSALKQTVDGYFKEASPYGAEEICRLAATDAGSRVDLSGYDTVLVPEVFFEPQRIEFFCRMPERDFRRFRFIIHDLLPLTHPEYFVADQEELCGYFHIIQRASHCAFASEYTRDVYYGRLKRSEVREGVVIPLGSDSLGARTTRPALGRPPTFSVLGTIEPRKNHKLILEAFEPLLGRIDGLSLSFIGRMGWIDFEFNRKVQVLASDGNSGFHFQSTSHDDTVRSYIDQSRATIYLSSAEGYGLPPVESLWVGTPVIASTTIPSLKAVGTTGVHYVDPLNAVNLREAVLAFLDDSYANCKTEETGLLDLPTWRSFAHEVIRWCAKDSAVEV